MKQQSGFTLIELVVVIVLLGILGAAATAKFQDLSAEARAAAVQGLAAEMQSGSAINYAKNAVGTTGTGIAVASCTDGTAVLTTPLPGAGNTPPTYSISSVSGSCTNPGDSLTCRLSDSRGSETADFALICSSS
jgi:MSHA pilin protein MshA